MNSSEGKTAFYDKFYDRIWRQFREARKDSLGSYFLKALTAFLRLKPVKLDDEATVRVMADLGRELESTESASVMMTLVESIVVVSQWKPKLFEPKFQDTVRTQRMDNMPDQSPQSKRPLYLLLGRYIGGMAHRLLAEGVSQVVHFTSLAQMAHLLDHRPRVQFRPPQAIYRGRRGLHRRRRPGGGQ